MDKILYIGGIASSAYQVDVIADILSAHYNVDVRAISFREALRNMASVAQFVRRSLVITHDAGITILRDMTPKEVIAIAPPMPTYTPLLILRTIPKTTALLKSRHESKERMRKIRRHHLHGLAEYLLHPLYNGGQIRHIARFDTACEAVSMIANGTKVTLCFMDNDLLFLNASEHPHIEIAKHYGVQVHNNILGHHDEFVLDPLAVLVQIDRV